MVFVAGGDDGEAVQNVDACLLARTWLAAIPVSRDGDNSV